MEKSSSWDDCSESVGVRGEACEGVREEGRIGTVLNAATLSVTDRGGRGSSLADGRRGVGDGNTISGWVAVEIGRKVIVTSGPEPIRRKQDGERERERVMIQMFSPNKIQGMLGGHVLGGAYGHIKAYRSPQATPTHNFLGMPPIF